MKIYFIGQKGIPAQFGGVEKHVEELSVRLVEAGHEVFVYTRPNYTKPDLTKYRGVNLISLPSISTKNFDAITHTFRACLDVWRRDADVIHFHSIGPSSLIWLVKLLKPGVPVVSTFHSKCYLHKKWGLFARFYLRLGEKSACNAADFTIAVSKSLTRYVKNRYGREICYIPNGAESGKKVGAREIKKWGLENGNYILIVARLIKVKGIQYAIKAFNGLKINKKLVIVGDNVYADRFSDLLKKSAKGNKNIIFTGTQSGRTLAELFSNAYFFIQSSELEGLSVALLEAMSYGKAVLASDIPENKEALGDAGFTFKSKDANDLGEKIKYILRNRRLLKKKEKLGRVRVKNFYNWDKIAEETITVYKEALLGKNKSAKLKFVRRFISLF